MPGIEASSSLAMMQIGLLRGVDQLIEALGGDARELLDRANIDPAALTNRHALVPFAAMAGLLDRAARSLGCPDFGMRLAAVQGREGASGPLYVAMRHSETLGAALAYAAAHTAASTSGTTMSLDHDREQRTAFLRFAVVAPGSAGGQKQALEHGLTLLLHHVQTLTNGRVRPREAWFMHAPLGMPATYRAFLGCPARFGQAMTGLLFEAADLAVALAGTDPWLYDLATSYIAREAPATAPTLARRVAATVERLLIEGGYGLDAVAGALAMHPRTLQRRLADEGVTLEEIREEVRRDLVRRYLPEPGMSLLRIAELLGYSEASALTRACTRWFGVSPKKLREKLRAENSG